MRSCQHQNHNKMYHRVKPTGQIHTRVMLQNIVFLAVRCDHRTSLSPSGGFTWLTIAPCSRRLLHVLRKYFSEWCLLNLTEGKIKFTLKQANKSCSISVIRDEVGTSLMQSKIMKGKLQYCIYSYKEYVQEKPTNYVVRRIEIYKEDPDNKWMKECKECMRELNINFNEMEKKLKRNSLSI